MTAFHEDSENIFLSSDNEQRSSLLDKLEFKYLRSYFPQTHHTQYRPYHKLAHMMVELVIWDQLKSQIKELIWKQLRESLREYTAGEKTSIIDLINNATEKDIGREVLNEIKTQIDLPIWTNSKAQILVQAWDEQFSKTSDHIRQVFSKIDFSKIDFSLILEKIESLKKGEKKYDAGDVLDPTISSCIHYAFIQFQMTAIAKAHSQKQYTMEDMLADFFKERLHEPDENIDDVLRGVVLPTIPSIAVRHQVELLCS